MLWSESPLGTYDGTPERSLILVSTRDIRLTLGNRFCCIGIPTEWDRGSVFNISRRESVCGRETSDTLARGGFNGFTGVQQCARMVGTVGTQASHGRLRWRHRSPVYGAHDASEYLPVISRIGYHMPATAL